MYIPLPFITNTIYKSKLQTVHCLLAELRFKKKKEIYQATNYKSALKYFFTQLFCIPCTHMPEHTYLYANCVYYARAHVQVILFKNAYKAMQSMNGLD